MDLTMGIANMSVAMNQSQLQQDLGIAVLKKAMDTTTQSAGTMLQDLMESVDVPASQLAAQPNLGANIDILS